MPHNTFLQPYFLIPKLSKHLLQFPLRLNFSLSQLCFVHLSSLLYKVFIRNNLEHSSHFSSNTSSVRLKDNLYPIYHTVYSLLLIPILSIHTICRYHAFCSNSTPTPKCLHPNLLSVLLLAASRTLIISTCLQRSISPKVKSPYLHLGVPEVLSQCSL